MLIKNVIHSNPISKPDLNKMTTKKSAYLLWCINNSGVESKLKHSQNSGKDGKNKHTCQSLRTVVSTWTQKSLAHGVSGREKVCVAEETGVQTLD